MERKITLHNQEIRYDLKKSLRARRMRLSISCEGNLTATLPRFFPESFAENFIREKADWILAKIKYFEKFKGRKFLKSSKRDYKKFKNQALEMAKERVAYFNQFYDFRVAKISIRNQKTRWGSCSKAGNLNFNYKIILLSERQRDYIIVHELCHLGEFNHSKKFWELVGKAMPDYKSVRKEIGRL